MSRAIRRNKARKFHKRKASKTAREVAEFSNGGNYKKSYSKRKIDYT